MNGTKESLRAGDVVFLRNDLDKPYIFIPSQFPEQSSFVKFNDPGHMTLFNYNELLEMANGNKRWDVVEIIRYNPDYIYRSKLIGRDDYNWQEESEYAKRVFINLQQERYGKGDIVRIDHDNFKGCIVVTNDVGGIEFEGVVTEDEDDFYEVGHYSKNWARRFSRKKISNDA